MVRVNTLLLAKYGIFQETRRCGPLAMTIVHPLDSLDEGDKADLMEFAQMIVAQHELDDDADQRRRDPMAAAYAMATTGDLEDLEDEGVLFDEA